MSLTAIEAKKMTVAKLKDELTKRGLPNDGKKEQLLERLLEAIQKAEEDAILNEGIDAGVSIGNEDLLLGDDLTGLDSSTSLSGHTSPMTKPLITAQPTKPTQAAPTSPRKAIVAPEEKQQIGETENGSSDKKDKPSKPVESVDAKLARAQRFGLPVTNDITKAKRAERFGSNSTAATTTNTESAAGTPVVSEDAKKKRAERFGLNSGSNTSGISTLGQDSKDKLIQRAARFGLPITSDGKTPASGGLSDPKLAERAKRFGLPTADDFDAKKRARLERFGST